MPVWKKENLTEEEFTRSSSNVCGDTNEGAIHLNIELPSADIDNQANYWHSKIDKTFA